LLVYVELKCKVTYSFFSAHDHVIEHEELVNVEQNSGKVANQEEDDDAQKNGGEVHLWRALLVTLLGAFVRHLDSPEDARVEVDQGDHRSDAGGHKTGPVDVESASLKWKNKTVNPPQSNLELGYFKSSWAIYF